ERLNFQSPTLESLKLDFFLNVGPVFAKIPFYFPKLKILCIDDNNIFQESVKTSYWRPFFRNMTQFFPVLESFEFHHYPNVPTDLPFMLECLSKYTTTLVDF